MTWWAAKDACSAKNTSTPVTGATWLLASKEQWEYMMGPDGAGSASALRDGFSSVGGSNLLWGTWEDYWSSSENQHYYEDQAWRYSFYYYSWIPERKDYELRVRACLAFGAQGSGPDPIELTSTDGETWTLASMPYYDVKLEVEYYTYAITVKEGTLDATSWQGKAGEDNYQALPLEGVDQGTAVSVKYNGTKKVKSVKAKKAAPATVLSGALVDGAIIKVNFKWRGTDRGDYVQGVYNAASGTFTASKGGSYWGTDSRAVYKVEKSGDNIIIGACYRYYDMEGMVWTFNTTNDTYTTTNGDQVNDMPGDYGLISVTLNGTDITSQLTAK